MYNLQIIICKKDIIETTVILCKKIKNQSNVIIYKDPNEFQSKYNSSIGYHYDWKHAEIVDHYCCTPENYIYISYSMFDNIIIIYDGKINIDYLLTDKTKKYIILCNEKHYKNFQKMC